jgi:hypothetical protein
MTSYRVERKPEGMDGERKLDCCGRENFVKVWSAPVMESFHITGLQGRRDCNIDSSGCSNNFSKDLFGE